MVKDDRHFLYLLLGFFFHLALGITLRWYTNLGLWGLAIVIISVLIWMTAGLLALTKETKLDELKGSLNSIGGYWEQVPAYWENINVLSSFEERYRPIKKRATVNERSLYE